MKYEDLKRGVWVLDEGTIALVVWHDEQETLLHSYGEFKGWDELVEKYHKILESARIMRPESELLPGFAPVDPQPSHEILTKLQTARRKKLAFTHGIDLTFQPCIGLQRLAEERIFSAMSYAWQIGMPPEAAHRFLQAAAPIDSELMAWLNKATMGISGIVEKLEAAGVLPQKPEVK